MQDSNPRPSVYKTAALPTELIRRGDLSNYSTRRYNPRARGAAAARRISSVSAQTIASARSGDAPLHPCAVIAESNNGGEMVEDVLRAVEPGLPVRLVHAARGKGARAEPVAALFEARRCLFAGSFPELEDELAAMTAQGCRGASPDRADAMVWALTELILRAAAAPRVRGL